MYTIMKRFILWAIVLLATSMVSSCELDDASDRHRIFYKVETDLGHLNPIYTSLYFYEYDEKGGMYKKTDYTMKTEYEYRPYSSLVK